MSDDDLGEIEARLAALDEPIKVWRAAQERAFAAQFRPKAGQLSTLMSKLPRAAAATRSIGPGPREDVYAALDAVCDLYLRSDGSRCALIRAVVHDHEAAQLLADYIGHASQMLAQGGRGEWLDRALAAASIDDQRRDYRDWLMSLGDVYLAANAKGIDPSPTLRRVAQLSNPQPHRAAPTPTREALAGFEKTAYFATSVLPRLR